MKTVMSTDWIKIHDHCSVYMARVFLTDEDNAYMIQKMGKEMKFFKVDPELLRLGELGFFERVMETAEEVTMSVIQQSIKISDV